MTYLRTNDGKIVKTDKTLDDDSVYTSRYEIVKKSQNLTDLFDAFVLIRDAELSLCRSFNKFIDTVLCLREGDEAYGMIWVKDKRKCPILKPVAKLKEILSNEGKASWELL